jgi:hypothetical protein
MLLAVLGSNGVVDATDSIHLHGARVLMEKAAPAYLSTVDIIGKPQPQQSHEVVFAIRQRNLERIDFILSEVSDPSNSKYGDYRSRSEVEELTSDHAAADAVLAFLTASGVSKAAKSRYGEYITATAPIAHWESLMGADFVTVAPKSGADSIHLESHVQRKTAARTMEYFLPESIAPLVVTVFNTIQMPVFPPQACSKIPLTPDQIQELFEATGEQLLPYSPGKPKTFGLTYPKLINSFYHIADNKGHGLGSQCVVASVGQTYFTGDQHMFESTFKITSEVPQHSYGGHFEQGYCQDAMNVSFLLLYLVADLSLISLHFVLL